MDDDVKSDESEFDVLEREELEEYIAMVLFSYDGDGIKSPYRLQILWESRHQYLRDHYREKARYHMSIVDNIGRMC